MTLDPVAALCLQPLVGMPTLSQKDKRAAKSRRDAADDDSNASSGDDSDSGSDEDYEDDTKSHFTRSASRSSLRGGGGRPTSNTSHSRSASRLSAVVSDARCAARWFTASTIYLHYIWRSAVLHRFQSRFTCMYLLSTCIIHVVLSLWRLSGRR